MAHQPAARPEYTQSQIEQYLDYINFPTDLRVTTAEADTQKGLEFIQELLKYHLSRVPFENLDLHYSPLRSISLDVDHLYNKIVERGDGRGGYCMENNTFFGTILRSLGFKVMPAGARVSSGVNMVSDTDIDKAVHTPLTHTVNIITIEGKRYFADVGFGNRGPTSAILLEHGIEGRCTGNDDGGNLYKLKREHIRDNTHFNDEQLLWVYSVRFSTDMKYIPIYSFSEMEFLPQDLRMASFYISKSPTSFFTYTVICSKFVFEDGRIVGDVTLYQKEVKERRFGKSKVLAEFKTEDDRVQGLKKYFGINLSGSEIRGIQGMVTAIG